ncbi:hypothetical protein cyc_03654 [Cyclospora cayetanensis]|uniref:Uncharacterized protein n=1 Tax=Cyclospora cayetanensis TaxID=88456 RepID=A0A1D3D0P6_9EIME|nr:hypothetical protein cyc_03654 [Cyclospora cayetanensis]
MESPLQQLLQCTDSATAETPQGANVTGAWLFPPQKAPFSAAASSGTHAAATAVGGASSGSRQGWEALEEGPPDGEIDEWGGPPGAPLDGIFSFLTPPPDASQLLPLASQENPPATSLACCSKTSSSAFGSGKPRVAAVGHLLRLEGSLSPKAEISGEALGGDGGGGGSLLTAATKTLALPAALLAEQLRLRKAKKKRRIKVEEPLGKKKNQGPLLQAAGGGPHDSR